MSADCLFCKIIAEEIPCNKLYEDEQLLAFEDINPQAPLHILIIPKLHIATTNELKAEHDSLVGKLVLRAKALAEEHGVQEDGYRLVFNCNEQGGQTVYHLHLHLLAGRQLRGLG